ncbi:MAG: type II toxin-antitoxin system RelE/ParE family toxin [Patescibacteria group bacterium]
MELIYSPTSIKHLKKIGPAEKKKAKRKIEMVIANPLMGKLLQGEHTGQRSVYAWPLRIIYTFESQSQTIEIVDVDYRGNVYKK